jgi:hypothetical protein
MGKVLPFLRKIKRFLLMPLLDFLCARLTYQEAEEGF